MSNTLMVYFNVASLKKESEVVLWYINFNSGGTPHTEEEINRVKVYYNILIKNNK